MRCSVVGGGAWGTALGSHLATVGHDVLVWAREVDAVDEINQSHRNTRFLPGSALAPTLRATTDLGAAAGAGSGLLLLATPSQHLREVLRELRLFLRSGQLVVVASKGIERGTLRLMTDVVAEELDSPATVVLSGPSFAAEVAAGLPTAVVAASGDASAARLAQHAFSTPRFRVYTQSDVIGVELGGALKNVMAIASGISDGLGLGFNARAALMTRGLAEMQRLGVAIGARSETFSGLAGIGDLVLTCTGALSRNRTLGMAIGEGMSLAQALEGRESVAEGVDTTESAYELSQRVGVEMPIVGAVYRTLFHGQSAADAIGHLMERELRSETDLYERE